MSTVAASSSSASRNRPARRPFRLVFLALLAVAASCGSTSPRVERELRILFIGNSLTYTNDLPGLVRNLGRGDPTQSLVVASVAFPDYSLEDHWNQGDALRAIRNAPWDIVVLQQGPSALPESRANLVELATRFAQEIRAAGARPALYMAWPPLSREGEWDAVTASYAAAAEAVDGLLLPAGEALRAARAADAGLTLFHADGFHPAPAGSYAVALVIYGVCTGISPVGLTGRAGGSELPPGQVAVLEQAAAEAISRFPGH
jgi:hypothetical protein